jgi:NAD(P)-dependent dehydrogenase (short-subunit alcohol dehydrogenase family)
MPEGGGWILVLGASSGFGSAVAIELARRLRRLRRAPRPARHHHSAEETKQAIEAAGPPRSVLQPERLCGREPRRHLVRAGSSCPAGGLRLLFHSLAFGSLLPLVGEDATSSARASQLEMTLDVMASSLVY